MISVSRNLQTLRRLLQHEDLFLFFLFVKYLLDGASLNSDFNVGNAFVHKVSAHKKRPAENSKSGKGDTRATDLKPFWGV